MNINLSGARYVTGTIPAAVSLLTKLGKCRMERGSLHGCQSRETHRQLPETLSLGLTKMSGSLPTTLGNLYKLRYLSLEGLVDLTGTIPTELGRLSNLGEFDLTQGYECIFAISSSV